MNWLAHLLLAEPTPEGTLGNLLGDLVKGEARKSLSLKLQRGLACHQAIDIYTDNHLIVKRSKSRISPQYRRFAGILIDVFYDYVLANNWSTVPWLFKPGLAVDRLPRSDYCDVPLKQFTTTTYASWSDYLDTVPLYAQGVIQRLIAEDWLASYETVAGVKDTLARISWRLNRRSKRAYDLTLAIAELTDNYLSLEQDFQQFFPQLQTYTNSYLISNKK